MDATGAKSVISWYARNKSNKNDNLLFVTKCIMALIYCAA